MAKFNPSFKVVCPGGLSATFLRKRGEKLYWRGKIPYGMETAMGTEEHYLLITDLSGNELCTEPMVFRKGTWIEKKPELTGKEN